MSRDEVKRSSDNREQVRERTRQKVKDWYVEIVGHDVEAQECDTQDAHGVVKWWLEPPPPGIDYNAVVVERPIGITGWRISIEKEEKKIRVFT